MPSGLTGTGRGFSWGEDGGLGGERTSTAGRRMTRTLSECSERARWSGDQRWYSELAISAFECCEGVASGPSMDVDEWSWEIWPGAPKVSSDDKK